MYTINYPVTIDVKLLLKGSDTLSIDQNVDMFNQGTEFYHNSKLHFICITNFISFCFVFPLSIIVFSDLSCSMFYNLFAILVNYNS